MTRRRKPLVIHKPRVAFGPREPYALQAVLLCLDAAKRTGTAVYVAGALRAYNVVNAREPHERRDAMRDAITVGEVRGLPVAVVCEAPFGGYQSAALSLNATVTLWQDTWKSLGQPSSRFLETTVGEWRRAFFGRAGMSRRHAQGAEQLAAQARASADMPTQRHYAIPADAAAAICLGQVAAASSGVRRVLGCDLVQPQTRKRPA